MSHGVAIKSHVFTFPNHEIRLFGVFAEYLGGHDHLQIARSVYHGVGVDLAHVPAPIVLLSALDVQKPFFGGRPR